MCAISKIFLSLQCCRSWQSVHAVGQVPTCIPTRQMSQSQMLALCSNEDLAPRENKGTDSRPGFFLVCSLVSASECPSWGTFLGYSLRAEESSKGFTITGRDKGALATVLQTQKSSVSQYHECKCMLYKPKV